MNRIDYLINLRSRCWKALFNARSMDDIQRAADALNLVLESLRLEQRTQGKTCKRRKISMNEAIKFRAIYAGKEVCNG